MSYENNPYYYPEKHGLATIGEYDITEPCYSFDLLVAWGDAEGIYLGTDSGCSCPTPFEDYEGRADMTGPLTAEQAIEEVRSLAKNYDGGLRSVDDLEAFCASIRDFTTKGA